MKTQENPIKQCMTQKENGQQLTSHNSTQRTSQKQTYGASDFLVKTFQSQGQEEVLKDPEVVSFIQLLNTSRAKEPKINPTGYSLKTLKTCYRLMGDGIIRKFSLKYPKQGTIVNGLYSIQKTSEFLKTEKESLLSDVLETQVEDQYYLTQEKVDALLKKSKNLSPKRKQKRSDGVFAVTTPDFIKGNGTRFKHPEEPMYTVRCFNPDGVAIPVIGADCMDKRPSGKRFKNNNESMFTLTGRDRHGVMLFNGKKYYIRKLTPKECFRLQGFTDEQFDKASQVVSESQLYKQAGNAVTVNVARRLGELIMNDKSVINYD